ncbi:MAG: DASS family sodium-coupled anion symporter [Rhodobacteraceae bacterium]|nr:MAG: DASS family sodium-coupled anion symporter [Paracoccaceae bacterium]
MTSHLKKPELKAQTEPSHLPQTGTDNRISTTRLVALIAGPLAMALLLLLPPPTGMTPEAWQLIAVTLWMVIWWLFEALPLPATALLPVVIFPLMNIMPVGDVTARYGSHLIFLFLGGFILAAAMQKWGLHRRIALGIVAAIGTTPSRIVMGFMLATAFLSMWISNTATAVMMYAVGVSVIDFIGSQTRDHKEADRFGISLMLAIAYAASIGGVGTLIGTPPNALLASLLSENYGIEIGFFGWMKIGIPVVLIMLPLTYVLLTRVIFPSRTLEMTSVRGVIDNERKALGPMSRAEKLVALVFGVAAFLWISRGFLGLPIGDAGIAIAAALALFALPISRDKGFLVDWSVARTLPWGVLLLFGGGLALAGAFDATGLAEWIGDRVGALEHVPLWLLILVVSFAIIYLTEITSNTASTATFLPILAAVAVGLQIDVLWLTVPVAMGASMAFMMPVATPPNAIIFSYEKLTLKHMVRAGFWLNILAGLVIFAVMELLAPLVFGI